MGILTFFNGLLSAQETYLKVDENWTKKLEQNFSHIQPKGKKKTIGVNEWNFHNQYALIKLDYNSVTSNYLKKYQSYRWFPKVLGLGYYYFPLFEAKLSQYGLPKELKYLAIVESNLNPRAKSHVGASGLWQFMNATGKEYGLAKNELVNTFYDPLASTDSACRYLKYLYSIFHDWNLVLSAYNSGQGTVLKAMKKANSKDYWKVREYLPNETRAYVPSFHAVKVLASNINLTKGLKYNFLELKKFQMKKPTTVQILKNQGFDMSNFNFFNPQILTNQIPQNAFVYLP